MRIAIMQPYFFPYLGYFQLLHAVDEFVLFDDVNFIKRGWINRNKILVQGNEKRITLELRGASQNKKINEIMIGGNAGKILKTLQQAYAKAPYRDVALPVIEACLKYKEENLAKYLEHSLRTICDYLDVDVGWRVSSDLEKDDSLKGSDKILDICRRLGADEYVNLPGGRSLYDPAVFANDGVLLRFMKMDDVAYPQSAERFVPNLSIIDLMMHNPKERVQRLLGAYSLE